MLLIACDFFEMLQYVSFEGRIFGKMHTDSVLTYYMHITHTSGMHFMQDSFSKTSESYTDILSEYKGIITLN